jgi:hypothetical protein
MMKLFAAHWWFSPFRKHSFKVRSEPQPDTNEHHVEPFNLKDKLSVELLFQGGHERVFETSFTISPEVPHEYPLLPQVEYQDSEG